MGVNELINEKIVKIWWNGYDKFHYEIEYDDGSTRKVEYLNDEEKEFVYNGRRVNIPGYDNMWMYWF